MRYRLEQIKEQLKNYQELCDIFFELARDEETKRVLEEILYEGTYNEFDFFTDMCNKDNPFLEGKRRISMAYLLIRNPETFYFFVQNQIRLFHGTNANALPTILKYGLNSIEESENKGIHVSTGESWSRDLRDKNFISFCDILSIACGYSTIKPKLEENELSFEVVLGITTQDAYDNGTCHVASEVPEVGIRNNLPLDSIKVISVPSEKVAFVRRLVSNTQIKVLPMDDNDKRFYYIDDLYGVLIYDEILAELKTTLEENRRKKHFSLEEIKHMTLGRVLSSIKSKIDNIKNMLNEEKGKSL